MWMDDGEKHSPGAGLLRRVMLWRRESKSRARVFFWDMRVRVLYFGALKDVFGCESEMVELMEGARVADLLAVCRGRGVDGALGFFGCGGQSGVCAG